MWAAIVLIFWPLVAFAQQKGQQTGPDLSASVLGPQLVVWSELQKPRPVPQPLPPPQPDPPAQQQAQPAPGAQAQQQPATQIFTGTIVKDREKYVLKVSGGTSYQIDDQDKARMYEGKQVKVVGTLDGKNILHAASIELLS